MKSAAKFLRGFAGAEEGATAIEYALIAAGISLAVIVSAFSVGDALNSSFYTKIVAGLASL